MPEVWTRYIQPDDYVRVRYIADPGDRYLAFLPSGVGRSARFDVMDKTGYGDRISFTNEPMDEVRHQNGRTERLQFDVKVHRAKEQVIDFLGEVSRVIGTATSDLGDIIRAQDIVEMTPRELAFFMRANHIIGADRAESTEGVTTSAPRGNRKIAINSAFNTLPAIVHELFHAIESDKLAELGPSLVEALTEYLATSATGLDIRRDMRGEGDIYAKELGSLRGVLALVVPEDRARVERMIYQGYFRGDIASVHQPVKLSRTTTFDEVFTGLMNAPRES